MKVLSVPVVVFLALLVFKLVHPDQLSWAWVAVPFWGPPAIVAGILAAGVAVGVVALAIAGVLYVVVEIAAWRRRRRR